jgi:putative nucleotidyltransferase with HDIG domain
MYALFLVAGLIVPYLSSDGRQLDLFRGMWVTGAYVVFLALYQTLNLPNSRRLTFQRLGLMVGETALAMMFITLFGGASGPFTVIAVIPPLLISLEHHWKYGLGSGVAMAAYLLIVGGEDPQKYVISLLVVMLPLIGLTLEQVEVIRKGIHTEDDYTKLDKAYQIARRETSLRHEHEQELHREKRRFEGLVVVAQGLAEEREEDSLLSRIVEVASDQLSARGAVVFLLKEGRLLARAESGLSEPMVQALQSCTDGSFLESLTEMGRPLSYGCDDPGESDRANQELVARFSRFIDPDGKRRPTEVRIDQLLGVPLATAQDDRAFGLLLVLNNNLDKPFSPAESRYLHVLSTNAAIALKNILFTAQLERSHWELIQALAQAIEAKDSYTSNHVGRVRDLSVEIARAIGLDRNQIRVIAIAATLHDVGKISTPDRVLLKPGPLTDEEYDIMKQHAPNGAQILRGIRSLPEGVEPMVRHHHERWDGRGYPDGKSGKDIPLGAQIISIADCFDAMTYDRPYRKGFPKTEALAKMELGCGTQFNPKLLCAFFAIQGFEPKTEPTAIDTYHSIIGKLRLGSLSGGDSRDSMVNPPHSTGSSGSKTEQRAKPLLMERN